MTHIYQRDSNRVLLLATTQIAVSILLCIIVCTNMFSAEADLFLKFLLFFLLLLYGLYPMMMTISFYRHDANICMTYDDETGDISYKDKHRELHFNRKDICSMIVHRGYHLMYFTSIVLEHEADIEVSNLIPLTELKKYAVTHELYDVEMETFLEMN